MEKCIDWTRRALRKQWPAFLLMAALLAMPVGYAGAQQSGGSSGSPPGQIKVLQGSQAPVSATKSYTKAEKETYQRKVALDLNEMQQKIDELKIKSRTVVQQKKRMMIKALIDLQNMADTARHTLAALETAPEQDWNGFKVQMDKAMANLNTAYQEVAAFSC